MLHKGHLPSHHPFWNIVVRSEAITAILDLRTRHTFPRMVGNEVVMSFLQQNCGITPGCPLQLSFTEKRSQLLSCFSL
jgi:hypothetical protein